MLETASAGVRSLSLRPRPIHLATTYFYDTAETLDRIFGHEEEGPSYSRYENPTNNALEELVATLENGHGALATCSGMTALQIAFQAALIDRPHSILSSSSIYGATIKLLDQVIAPFDVNVRYVDMCDLTALENAIAKEKPGCIFLESVSNPILRVADIAKIAAMAKAAGAAMIVDSTFACPMLMRPLDLGANIVVHSATKYLSGHGDVLGGVVVSDAENHENVRMLSRIAGGTLGPFESYLTMRGVKTLALRFERQCENARKLAECLAVHPSGTRLLLRRPEASGCGYDQATVCSGFVWGDSFV